MNYNIFLVDFVLWQGLAAFCIVSGYLIYQIYKFIRFCKTKHKDPVILPSVGILNKIAQEEIEKATKIQYKLIKSNMFPKVETLSQVIQKEIKKAKAIKKPAKKVKLIKAKKKIIKKGKK